MIYGGELLAAPGLPGIASNAPPEGGHQNQQLIVPRALKSTNLQRIDVRRVSCARFVS